MSKFTHIDSNNKPTMVDVSEKQITDREASAQSSIKLTEEMVRQMQGSELISKKGPVVHTAIIAGTMAVKKTSELIPFCHPLAIEKCSFEYQWSGNTLTFICTVKNSGKTGVEMEALIGATTAALTVYDMCKALSHHMEIFDTKLLFKKGGKSDFGSS